MTAPGVLTALIVVLAIAEAAAAWLLARWWRTAVRRSPVRLRREASVGTLRWREQSDDGRLDAFTAFEYRALGVRRVVDLAWWAVGSRGWHRRRPMPRVRVERPDGEFALRVEERWKAIEPEWLRNHSLRTYALALHYGMKRGYEIDTRVLWGAALLHDVGLADSIVTARRAGTTAPFGPAADRCFTIRSAEVAEEIAAATDPIDDHGPELAERVSEAILLHLNPAVSKSLGVEAWLLQLAAMADLTGLGFHRLHSSAVDRIYAACPLLDQQSGVQDALAAEIAANPSCRVACLPFGRRFVTFLIRHSPVYDLYTRGSRELFTTVGPSNYVDLATTAAKPEAEPAQRSKDDVSAEQGEGSKMLNE